MDGIDELARELDETSRAADREPTVIELMNGPKRPDARQRKTVQWIGLAFSTMLLALTCAVVYLYGLDVLTLVSLVVLGFLVAAMIGTLRYKGEDPMQQFEPHDDLRPSLRRKKKRRPRRDAAEG